jgi:plastocyanin domain-containing protein
VTVIADARGFNPTEIRAVKGSPVTLLFTRTTDNTCAKEVVIPDLKVRRPLPLNEVVAIVLPTEVEHTYRFQCGMGMWEGTIVVK